MLEPKVWFFTVFVWNRVCELGMFFRGSYFFIIWRQDHFPLNVYANLVHALTACHALRSSAGLQGFRSEIGYQVFDKVWNRVTKITDFFLKEGKGFRKGATHPHPTFLKVLPRVFRRNLYTNGGSLCQAFLAEIVETGTKNFNFQLSTFNFI